MKKLFLTIILFFFIGFPGNTNAQLINPLFSSTVTAKGVVVSISVNGPINSTVIPVISEQPITTISSIQETPGFGQKTINVMGVPAYWQGQLKPDTNYEVRIVQITGLRSQDKKFVTDSIKIKTEKAGEIFYNKLGKSDFEKTGTNQYRLKGSIDATKHKSTDLVPLSTIQVSGLFYDLKSKETILTLPNITPNQDGSYEFDIKSNGIFNENTTYGLRIVFSSTTGASATYEVKGVNTSKGYIIPETGKEAEDFLNKNSYRLLAPIPGMTMLLDPELCKLEQQKDPGQICDINAFLNFLLQLAIGAAAVILVVRIIISGYGYMLTDVPYIKVKLKGQFIEAMIGLVVALSSYLILNTVNPKLVSNNINIGVASFEIVDFPDAGDDSIDPDFKLGKATYSKDATISPGTVSAVKKLEQGWEISRFIVFTNNRMLIELKKGQDLDNTNLIDISPGKNGYAPEGAAKGGDNKTPIGTWKIIDIRYKPGVPQFNGNGSNMGAAFWHLSPTKSGERGIGMHGTKTGGLSATNGCIRMKNTDLLALQPYVKKGIPVIVKQ